MGRLEWFDSWVTQHMRVNPKSEWPKVGTDSFRDFFVNWHDRFAERGITQEEAEEASIHLSTIGGLFRDDHLHKLLERILIVRRQAEYARLVEHQRRDRMMSNRLHARRVRLEWHWLNLDMAQRERIMALCRSEHPHLGEVPRWLQLFALERMVAEGLCEDPDPELAKPPE